MWKKLFAAVAGLGLCAGSGAAQSAPNADPPVGPLAPPASGPQYARADKSRPGLPTPESVMEAEGFRGAIFSTPLPPSPRQVLIPAGGVLAAPVILPGATKPGEPLFEVLPAGGPFDPAAAPRPENFVWGTPCTCPPAYRVWGSAEFLLGTTRGVNVPPVVTTGPASAGLAAGAVGAPGTVALFGGRKMLDDWRTGLRIEGGVWLGPSEQWAVWGRFYSLFSTSEQLLGGGDGTNVVNVPQLITIGGLTVQVPVFVGFPGATVGTVATTAQTSFTGGDLSVRRSLYATDRLRFEAFAGYRQLHLGDELDVSFRASGALAGILALTGDDSIRTRNNFYGGQVGGIGSFTWGRWSLQGLSSVALGVNASDLDFSRTRIISVGTAALPLVQVANGGRVDYFSVAAEAGVKLGFRVSEHAKLTFGYTALYWSNVRRAQEQFNLSPTLTGGTTHFFSHMLGWGAEVRY
jgi:Putative beta barrel porin-7 (BBP7)